MKLPTLFKQQKNKTFDYTPRYYDERKERLLKQDKTKGSKVNTAHRKPYRLVNKNINVSMTTRVKSSSNLRTFIILVFLLIVVWVIIRYI